MRFLITVILSLACLVANAQTLRLSELDNSFSLNAGGSVTDQLVIENTSNKVINVGVELMNSDIYEGQSFEICYNGSCVTPNNPEIKIFRLEPYSSAVNLTHRFFAGMEETISSVRFRVYNLNNPADFVTHQVDFFVHGHTPEGIFHADGKLNVSTIYPNPLPANTDATVNYQILEPFTQARVVIINVLGHELASLDLEPNQTRVKVNHELLDNGLYFYTLFVDGKSLATNKFIVKK
jgi:hypothetical protein